MKQPESSPETPYPTSSILMGYGVVIALFHLWGNTVGAVPELAFNALHLGLLGSFGFLQSATRGQRIGGKSWMFMAMAVLLLAGGLYPLWGEDALHRRGETMVVLDMIMAGLTIGLALVLCWRTSGPAVPLLVLLCVSYVLFLGQHLGGILHFRGLNLTRVLYRAYFTGEGLFGMIAGISSSFVFMFILFSSFLLKSGGGDFIIRLARVLFGGVRGSAGYISVLASGLMGTISGSAVANTVATGSITIPLMQRSGFEGKFSAAICVAASTGGQLMPPIMGAGAFIMAQWTGQPYSRIMGLAIIPALLFFASLLFHVFFETRRMALPETSSGTRERLSEVLKEGVHFLVPIAVLIGLLASGFSPTYAAGWGILAVVGASWLTRRHRMTWRTIGEALAMGTRTMVPTGVLLVTTGLIIGSLNMTGLSVGFSQLVVEMSGGHLFLALVLIAFASLVLGMGLPVTAAYVMLAVVGVPALRDLGISLLAAHMILFWLSQDSNVTPPVCLAAFSGAAIAGTPPMATGLQAWRLSKVLYVVPLLFAYTPLIDGSSWDRIRVGLLALAGLFAMTAGMARWWRGPLSWRGTLLAWALALSLFWPNPLFNVLGVVVFVLVWIGRRPQRA